MTATIASCEGGPHPRSTPPIFTYIYIYMDPEDGWFPSWESPFPVSLFQVPAVSAIAGVDWMFTNFCVDSSFVKDCG